MIQYNACQEQFSVLLHGPSRHPLSAIFAQQLTSQVCLPHWIGPRRGLPGTGDVVGGREVDQNVDCKGSAKNPGLYFFYKYWKLPLRMSVSPQNSFLMHRLVGTGCSCLLNHQQMKREHEIHSCLSCRQCLKQGWRVDCL